MDTGHFRELAEKISDDVIATRRHLHEHPELSFSEHETAAFVKARLEAIGIAAAPVAATGIVAVIVFLFLKRKLYIPPSART